jgi:hypothetical protein
MDGGHGGNLLRKSFEQSLRFPLTIFDLKEILFKY